MNQDGSLQFQIGETDDIVAPNLQKDQIKFPGAEILKLFKNVLNLGPVLRPIDDLRSRVVPGDAPRY